MQENFSFNKYLNELSINTPTPIQTLCFQHLFEGKSVLGLAPTGSGKTLAFVLPLLLRLNFEDRNTQLLILVPTRELGSQIARVCQQVSDVILSLDKKNALVRTAFGGSPIAKQIEEISKKPHILIATPGTNARRLGKKSAQHQKTHRSCS
jgi:superfamily II DNA/RNA helicase